MKENHVGNRKRDDKNLFRGESDETKDEETKDEKAFWTHDFANIGSWIWKELLKLRHIARPFIKCSLTSGLNAFFWHDDWTGFGSLLEIVGDIGPMVSGIHLEVKVADQHVGNLWNLSRSRNPALLLLKACIPSTPPDLMGEGADLYLWKSSSSDNTGRFSTSKTWRSLNPAPPRVEWHKTVWFPERIPKHAFNMWVVFHERLFTRDRLIGWGLPVSSSCLLCGTHDETGAHLFFSCTYSAQVWQGVFSQSTLNPPADFTLIRQWIQSATSDQKLRTIINLLFQAVVYFIWRERNGRLHQTPSRTADSIKKEIFLCLRAKLAALDRRKLSISATSQSTRPSISMLGTWFGFIQTG